MPRNTLSPFWWQDLIFSPSQLGDSEFRGDLLGNLPLPSRAQRLCRRSTSGSLGRVAELSPSLPVLPTPTCSCPFAPQESFILDHHPPTAQKLLANSCHPAQPQLRGAEQFWLELTH